MVPERIRRAGFPLGACALLASLCLGFVHSGCDRREQDGPRVEILNASERAWLDQHAGMIRLAPDPNFPPFEFFSEHGEYQGIVSDYVHRIEERLGIRFRLVRKSTWDEVVQAFQAGEVDVVPAMTPTRQREAFMRFTEPYIEVPSVIVAREEETRSLTLYDLADSEVLVLEGYASHQYLLDHFDYLRIRTVPDTATGLREVAEGRADFLVVHQATFAYVQALLGLRNLHIVGNTNHLVRLALASRKDWPELHRILAKALATIGPEERAEIYNSWAYVMPGRLHLDPRFWMALVGVAALVIGALLLIGLWNRELRRRVHRKTMELRDVRDHLLDLFDGMPSALIVIDRDGRITRINAAADELVEASSRGVLGTPFWEAFPFLEPYRERCMRLLSGTMVPGRAPEAGPKMRLGTQTWTFSVFPIRSEGDRGAAIRLDEVTDLEQAEQQLRQAQKLETVGTLAGGLAHDFNNYLTAMTGILSLMDAKVRGQAEPARSVFANYVGLMNESAGRASQLVQQLLTFARSREPEVVPVDLNQAVARVMAMCRTTLDASVSVELRTADEPAMVLADPVQIEQALLNLVINAGHAMTIMRAADAPQGGTLKVMVRRAAEGRRHPDPVRTPCPGERWWVVSVVDTGVGMDAATRDKVFDPFFSCKPKQAGSGLGLTMVYNIVRAHGGFIDLRSQEGVGTTFDVVLPDGGVIPEDVS
jgi:PAS domain S-box-containing protein